MHIIQKVEKGSNDSPFSSINKKLHYIRMENHSFGHT